MRTFYGWLHLSWPLLVLLLLFWILCGNEVQIATFFQKHRESHPWLKSLVRFISDWANPPFYAVYTWILWRGWREKRSDLFRLALIYVVVQLGVAVLTVHGLKMLIGKPRPGVGILFDPITTDPGHQSMPSGHTTEITGAVLPLGLRSSRRMILLILGLLVALTGFSRVYTGWHHPLDVFCGWLLGSVAGIAIHFLVQKDNHA